MTRTLSRLKRRTKGLLDNLSRTNFANIGSLFGKPVHATWWIGKPNFGDLITPALLQLYGFFPIHAPAQRSQLLSTGSILQSAPVCFTGVVLGSGLIKDVRHPLPNATILALRGELSRQRVCPTKNVALGDPGLLMGKLLTKRKQKTFSLGIIPHYVDAADPRIRKLVQRYPKHVKIVDVQQSPRKVLADIDSCECVISSSLHGIVAADALGLPRAWIQLSNKVVGEGFKFRDYSSAINVEIYPYILSGDEPLASLIKMTKHAYGSIAEAEHKLDRAFHTLKTSLTTTALRSGE